MKIRYQPTCKQVLLLCVSKYTRLTVKQQPLLSTFFDTAVRPGLSGYKLPESLQFEPVQIEQTGV